MEKITIISCDYSVYGSARDYAHKLGEHEQFHDEPEENCHPGAQLQYVEDMLLAVKCGVQPVVIFTNSEIIFNAIRLAIVKGELNCEDVLFQHFTNGKVVQNLKANKYGAILTQNWPEQFFCIGNILAEQILDNAMKKRTEEKKKDGTSTKRKQ